MLGHWGIRTELGVQRNSYTIVDFNVLQFLGNKLLRTVERAPSCLIELGVCTTEPPGKERHR